MVEFALHALAPRLIRCMGDAWVKQTSRDIGVSGCISGLFTLLTAQISCSSV